MGKDYRIISPTAEEIEILQQLAYLPKSDKFVLLESKEEIRSLSELIEYKVQEALYEVILETNPALPWDDFVFYVRSNPKMRETIKAVAIHAADHFDVGKLDFSTPAEALEHFDHAGPAMSRIFNDRLGLGLITFLLMRTEAEYYRRLNDANPHYTWDIYRRELENNKKMWKQLFRTFQYGLFQIDYKSRWYSEEIT